MGSTKALSKTDSLGAGDLETAASRAEEDTCGTSGNDFLFYVDMVFSVPGSKESHFKVDVTPTITCHMILTERLTDSRATETNLAAAAR